MVFSDSVFDQTSVFWYKKSKHPNGITWEKFNDLAHLKLGMLIGSFIDKEMESTFEEKRGIHRGKNVENLLQVLLKDRVDLVAIDESVSRYIITQNGQQDKISVVKKPINIKDILFWLIKKSKMSSFLDKINSAITKLHQDGTIKKYEKAPTINHLLIQGMNSNKTVISIKLNRKHPLYALVSHKGL